MCILFVYIVEALMLVMRCVVVVVRGPEADAAGNCIAK